MSLKFLYLFFYMTSLTFAQDEATVDKILRKKILNSSLIPMEELPLNTNEAQVELGRRLFMDPLLSGNKKMSCLACHNPRTGLGDRLPLSRTENGRGILQRNSPHLFNVGLPSRAFMFWDGRVQYDGEKQIFKTPEPALNGVAPEAFEISNAMTSALAAQAIFPIVSSVEMMGLKGENEIADAKNNLEAWGRIIERLKKDRPSDTRTSSYNELFKRAYPKIETQKINIGHVGESLAAFQREAFQSNGSPFNNYLRGDNHALSFQQKKGLAVFIGKGKCINCHSGSELGNNRFFASVGVPSWGETPVVVDRGRGEVILDDRKNFFFKTVSLLNIGLTAPYMHNGSFDTLREVINHYSNINTSLLNYDLPKNRRESMPVQVAIINDSGHLNTLVGSMQAAFLRNGLNLTEIEKDDLEIFLSEALTDPKWKKQ